MGTSQTTIYDSILIASVVLGIIILYFLVSMIRQQRINITLRKKNILQEISGLEKERARIASDLHDELGPLLSSVKMRINGFDLKLPDELEELEKTNGYIDTIIRRMRDISFDLMPVTLVKQGLVKALSEYVGFLAKESKIHFTFTQNVAYEIDEDKSVNIYRIVQEAVHNAIKYSQATEIAVEVNTREGKLLLGISDNGIGFDHKRKLSESKGIGLRSIINRVHIAGGRLFV